MVLVTSDLARRIIGAAIATHRQLGPGLLESTYRTCLCAEFADRHLNFTAEVRLPVRYRGRETGAHYRLDLVVEGQIVVELKAVEVLLPLHTAQLATYLKLAGLRQGLLINFNVPILRHGLRSVLNPSAPS